MKVLYCSFLFLIAFFLAPQGGVLAQQQGEESYLAFADKMPEPVGGMKAIYSKITYPEFARRSHIEGKVYALAYINEKGDVDDVKIIKGLEPNCNKEVMQAIMKSLFSPGINNGSPTKVKLSLRIEFKLS